MMNLLELIRRRDNSEAVNMEASFISNGLFLRRLAQYITSSCIATALITRLEPFAFALKFDDANVYFPNVVSLQ